MGNWFGPLVMFTPLNQASLHRVASQATGHRELRPARETRSWSVGRGWSWRFLSGCQVVETCLRSVEISVGDPERKQLVGFQR